jgi:hypothetical protein
MDITGDASATSFGDPLPQSSNKDMDIGLLGTELHTCRRNV